MHDARVAVELMGETDDPVVAEVFSRLAGGAVGIVNIHRLLANTPDVFSAFIGLAHALRFKTQLDPAERELAILRALWRHDGDYEIGHHRRLGAAAGLTDEELRIALSDESTALLSARKRAIVDFADCFARRDGIPPAVASALASVLDNRSRVELSLTLALYVGLAHMTAAVALPMD